ncbi:MAG: hypothetical protein D6730_03895 [Bacteroidetes bacterium]|nr:MAG: hypothetical protein D6730_03895 [Bacteroidota bacterium]
MSLHLFQPLQPHHSASHTPPEQFLSDSAKTLKKGIIVGEAQGPAKSLASLFQISLYGPDDKKAFVTTRPFDLKGQYEFENLTDGKYWIVLTNKSGTAVKVSPKKKVVEVKAGKILTQDFVFK